MIDFSTNPVVVLDACVLYSAPVRDLLLYLAHWKLFHPRWTDRIQEEWTRNLLKNRSDLKISQLQKTVQVMNKAFPEADVQGFEKHIETLQLPDTDDRHVLAAALETNANILVTNNLKDFPTTYLSKFGIEVLDADLFISSVIQSHPEEALNAFRQQVSNLKNPPRTQQEVLLTLEKCSLKKSVALLRNSLKISQ